MKIKFIKKRIKDILNSKWRNFLFPVSSSVIIFFWGFIMRFSYVDDAPITFKEWFEIVFLFFCLFILPYDIIRWFAWGRKNYFKKLNRRLQIMKESTALLTDARRLADIINETTNRNTFEKSFEELKQTYLKLIKYERFDIFVGTLPSDDLKELLAKENIARKAFEEREVVQDNIYFDYDVLNGYEFERFCAHLLVKNGFENVFITQGSGDHGIDILAEKDDITYAIQCKCYSCNVGNDAIQQALAGKKFYKRDIAVVLTNQYFTQQAMEEAEVFGVKLWDRNKLDELIQNINK